MKEKFISLVTFLSEYQHEIPLTLLFISRDSPPCHDYLGLVLCNIMVSIFIERPHATNFKILAPLSLINFFFATVVSNHL